METTSKSQIDINFNQAKNQAKDLRNAPDKLNKLSKNSFQPGLKLIAANWTGDNANAFIRKGEALGSNLDSIARELRETADAIEADAKRIWETEMEALRIAQERTYLA